MPACILLNIDGGLRFVLYGVSVLLDIDLAADEIERLFAEAELSDAAPKLYEFHRSPRVLVSGRVEEHEPGMVWLSVEAPKFHQATVERLVESAKHVSFGRGSVGDAR